MQLLESSRSTSRPTLSTHSSETRIIPAPPLKAELRAADGRPPMRPFHPPGAWPSAAVQLQPQQQLPPLRRPPNPPTGRSLNGVLTATHSSPPSSSSVSTSPTLSLPPHPARAMTTAQKGGAVGPSLPASTERSPRLMKGEGVKSPPPASFRSTAAQPSASSPLCPSASSAALRSHPALQNLVRSHPQLNDAQLEAIAYEALHPPPPQPASSSPVFPPLALVACPGSGKTLTLACRIAYFLSHHRIPPASLLCITFTRKAKLELEDRVSRLLQSTSTDIPPSAVGDMTVSTFHSFAYQLLRQHSGLLGVSGRLGVLKPKEVRLLVKELLVELYEESRADVDLPDIAEEPSHTSLRLPLEPHSPPATGGWISDAREEELNDLVEMVEAEERKRGIFSLSPPTPLPAVDPPPTASSRAPPSSARSSSCAFSSSRPLNAAALNCLVATSTLRLTEHRQRQGLHLKQVRGQPRLCTRLDARADDERDGGMFADLLHRYDERLQQLGRLSMDDFLPALLALFRAHLPVLQDMRRRFSHLFVDEGQDSSRIDLCVLLALMGYPHWEKAEERSREGSEAVPVHRWRLARPADRLVPLHHLTIVGDPEQSIYGFRGADSQAFRILHHLLAEWGMHTLALSVNYRSTKSIVDVAARVIACCPGRPEKASSNSSTQSPSPTRSASTPSPVRASSFHRQHSTPAAPTPVTKAVTRPPSASMTTLREAGHLIVEVVSDNPVDECAAIVRHIQRLTREGPIAHRYSHQDIAVLARTREIARRVRMACKQAEPSIPTQRKRRAETGHKQRRKESAPAKSDEDDELEVDEASNGSRLLVSRFREGLSTPEWLTVLSYSRLLLAHHSHLVSLCDPAWKAHLTVDAAVVADSLRFLLTRASSADAAASILRSLEQVQSREERWREDDRAKRRRSEGLAASLPSLLVNNLYDIALLGLMDGNADSHDAVSLQRSRVAAELRQKVWGVAFLRRLVERMQRLHKECIDSVHRMDGEEGSTADTDLQLITVPISAAARETTQPSSPLSDSALNSLQSLINSQRLVTPSPCSCSNADVPCSRWLAGLTALHSFLHLVDTFQLHLLYPALQRGSAAESTGTVSFRTATSAWASIDMNLAGSHAAGGGGEKGVFVSTIHQAKGLEWKVVFVASCNEGILPMEDHHPLPPWHPARLFLHSGEELKDEVESRAYALDGDGCDEEGDEQRRRVESMMGEECRVAYVAVSRACERLFLSWTRTGKDGRPHAPSRFLANLPPDLLIKDDGKPAVPAAVVVEGQGLRKPLTEIQKAEGQAEVGERKRAQIGRWGASGGGGSDDSPVMFRRASDICSVSRPLSSRLQ